MGMASFGEDGPLLILYDGQPMVADELHITKRNDIQRLGSGFNKSIQINRGETIEVSFTTRNDVTRSEPYNSSVYIIDNDHTTIFESLHSCSMVQTGESTDIEFEAFDMHLQKR